MSDTSTQTTEQTAERKPPTLADIVREKTDDGKRIIDFFLDVMEDRIDGAELCHRIDAAKQLEKHRSKAAARFLAKYRGVPCGHSTRGRPDSADPCSAEERSLVAVTLNAPATLTRDFLTVLSGIDEFLMARLIRAQTADGGTVIEFLDDVMQDRNDGFKTHHRIAAAKELIVHIVRDEQPVAGSVHPEPVEGSAHPEPVEGPDLAKRHEANSTPTPPEPAPAKAGGPAESLPRTRYGAGTHPVPLSSVHTEPGSPEPVERVEGSLTSVHTEPGSPEPVERVEGPVLSTAEGPADSSSVVPAKEPAEGRQDDKARRPRGRRTRTQRRRDGAARAATLGKHPGSERNKEEKQDKPTPVELTIAERRIKERLEQHWHEPDPWTGPIDSTTPGRSPPW